MKFTWGHAMVLVLLSFMAFIISFIVRLNISELVTEDYYQEEVKYQGLIDGKENFNKLTKKPSITFDSNEIKILFYKPFTSKNSEGTIELLRPSDTKGDIKIPLLLDEEDKQRIPTVNLLKGKYYIILDWQTNGKRYYYKETLKIK